METEQALLTDIQSGDRKAMRRLYDRFKGYATATALRYVPKGDEVGDVLQNAFVKILTSIGRFDYRGEGSLKAWVASVVAHEAIDHVRQHERVCFVDIIPDVADEPDPVVEEVPPDVLTRLIGRLPAGYRMVLNMFVFEQMSHKEIAQRLGIKENSSASQFSRAKRMLAQMINDYLKTRQI